MIELFCCLLCSCCALGSVVGIYSVRIVFPIGVVALNKISVVVLVQINIGMTNDKLIPLKNCHKESLITSRCPSFYYPTNQFGIPTNKSGQMNLT